MDDGDIYWRNADHRLPGRVPTGTLGVGSRAYPPAQVSYPAGGPVYTPPPAYPATYPQSTMIGQNPIYAQPPVWGGPWGNGPLGALFGGVNIGQLVDLVGQGFAAIRSLPAAPSSTGDVATDVANFTTYQQALAEHGKFDEQIRTGVHIIAKLLGA